MRSPQISAGVIPYFQKNGEYVFLCIKHQKGHRWFPKWGIEPYESESEAAVREFTEETWIINVKVNSTNKFIEHFPIEYNGEKLEKTVTFFLGKISESEIQNINLQTREMADYKVWTHEEILETLTYASAKHVFTDAFNFLKK